MSGSKWRWLLVGSFSAAPTGRKYPVSGERFAGVMKRVDVRAEVPIPPVLGALVDEKPVVLHFDRPRTFRLGDIVDAVGPLRQLEDLAAALARDRDVPPTVAAARVEKIVGAGRLAEAVRGGADAPAEADDKPPTPQVHEPPTPSPAAPPTERDSTIDAIFSKVASDSPARPSTTKTGLDAFIGAMRSGKPAGVKVDPTLSLDAAATIRAAVREAALRILGHPVIAQLESSWRGLKMVMAESPGHEDLAVHMVDADADGDDLQLAMERHVSKVDPSRPDAVFIAQAVAPSTLAWLAELAADRRIPIVVGVNDSLTGRIWEDPEDVAENPEWAALRQHPGAPWLCAVANPVLLANEETPDGPRVVVGSAAWGMAALLTAAIKRDERVDTILGRPGALVAPAAHEVDCGMSEPRTIPTAAFAAIPQQKSAAKHGVVLLGSEAGSDQIIAATATMVGKGAMLPDRITHAARSRG